MVKRKVLIILLIFILGFSLRIIFAPKENETADPFEILNSANTLAETGRYLVPGIGSADLKIHYKFAGWPVGFPLMLSLIFKFFGYNEFLARLFTVFLSSSAILFVAIICNLFFSIAVTYLATTLMAIHPLLVAFNSRIFTNNPALLLLISSLTFLLISTVEKGEELKFVKPSVILSSNWRRLNFLMSFLLLGFLLTIRDTDAVFIIVYLFILYKSGFFYFIIKNERLKIIGLALIGIIMFIIGFLPSIYYNYQNYGRVITSTHYQWGGRLDIRYLIFGTNSAMGLPGAIVLLLSAVAYCFPLISLLFINRFTEKDKFFLIICLLLFLPILIINGSYPVSSTGAAPRYLLPLIPIVCILTARSLINLSKNIKLLWRISLFLGILIWQLFFTYPFPILFKISPIFAYAAHYSPIYQLYPYKNYPTHINALSKWVKEHTPENAVILVTPSQPYHFYFYAKRNVITFPNVTDNVLKKIIISRPIFLVEDHEATYNPRNINEIKKLIENANLNYFVVHKIGLFSPRIGNTQMHIYQVTSAKQ
jgi:hypothetical protein